MFPVEGLYVSLENYECPISSLLPVFSFTVFVFGTEGVECTIRPLEYQFSFVLLCLSAKIA
jgi:hypothetical protein